MSARNSGQELGYSQVVKGGDEKNSEKVKI